MEMDMKNNANSSAFWNFLSGLVSFEAPLWNWRLRMGNAIDFERFRSAFLHPEERFTTLIMCPEQCSASCGFRKVKTTVDGTHKAVCHQHLKPAFMVSNREVLMHGVNMVTLLSGVAQALEIEPRITPFKTWEQVWDMGCKKIGSLPIKVFFTLRNWDHEVIDLILNLNRMLGEKYILLVSSRDLVSRTSKMALEDNKAVFIPLNEVLDFNLEAEPILMRPLDSYLEPLQPDPPYVEAEPDNIFRRCGDAWEVRFAGGEKFMLTTGNTGASYLHFMLARPNVATPVIEIMRGFATEKDGRFVESIDDGNLADGYAVGDLPLNETDNIADEEALRQYRDEIKILVHELDCAREVGDNITAEQLRQDLESLTQGMNEMLSPAGQKKKFADPTRKIADAFRHAVVFVIEKTKRHDRKLAEHLATAIHYGQTPCYFPDISVDWTL